jgi:hypothetical protein
MDYKDEVKAAKDILYYVNNRLKTDKDFFKLDIEERYKDVSSMPEYKQFALTFPIVSRYIIQLGQFSSKIFVKYLTHLNKVKPTAEERAQCVNDNEEQMMWLNKQRALYVKWLYAEKSRSHDSNESNKIYQETLNLLNEDTKKMFKILKEEKQKLKEKESEYMAELREKVINNIQSKENKFYTNEELKKNTIDTIIERINEL